ncbi:uncharacterized protein LOC119721988 [Patiria miniata]|uniref:Methyltransferase FkbM domain-containing protein n=1 Tax=Patiria miniata TaxID=46514 RepID=A0A913Z7X0_PATMI|nr:uncharacterized protein LOC119721988 [Patiria miniata]XP_038047893.1 uncharacterized protein LOC119721988 [Patiria miniata]
MSTGIGLIMRSFRSNKMIVALTIFVCLGLIPSYSVVQSYLSPSKIHLTADELARLYNKDVATEPARIEMGHRSKEADVAAFLVANGTTKVLLDCGANTASSVQLFRDTYPDGRNYVIHSFEIDERLGPYFSPYRNHHLHCPVGVAAEYGNVTAYLESVWGPDKGLNNGRDMQWGGGTFYADPAEIQDKETGGKRKLSTRRVIPTIDLAQWIKENFSVEDYVILKLDVEGAEFNILQRMLQTGAFKYIDKLYGEYHNSQPTGWSQKSKNQLVLDIGEAGFTLKEWEADRHMYSDFEKLHPPEIPLNTPGTAGEIYSLCQPGSVSLAVAIGMNHKRAHKVISTLQAYPTRLPLTLFVYGDFVEQFPDTVMAWARRYRLGIREDGDYPKAYLETMPKNLIRRSLVSSLMRLQELDLKTALYWPAINGSSLSKFKLLAKTRGLRIIQPTVEFPGKLGTKLTSENYYHYRDVERVPRALRLIHNRLMETQGGILGLDSDIPDTYTIAVFLMDYLVKNSNYRLVEVEDCVREGTPVAMKGEDFDIWAPKHTN